MWKEKQTDTSIATEIVADAFLNRWDVSYLVSGDSDLVPPLKAVKDNFPDKKVIVVFPPSRTSGDLSKIFGSYFSINETMLKKSQFSQVIQNGERTIVKPSDWDS